MKVILTKVIMMIVGAMFLGLSYAIMMGAVPFKSVDSEMFAFLISGTVGLLFGALSFTKIKK